MDIREVKLYDCKIDKDFKENKNGFYDTVAKSKIGEFENIIFLELSKDQFEYINKLDYKNILFNIKGHMQVKVNKKGIPFLYFKANFIMSIDEINKIKKDKLNQLKNKKNKNTPPNEKVFNWMEKLEELGYKTIEVNTSDIILKDKEHLKSTTVDFSTKYLKNDLKVVLKKLDNSDKYELILGWKALIGARVFDKKLTAYLVDVNRKDLLEKIKDPE